MYFSSLFLKVSSCDGLWNQVPILSGRLAQVFPNHEVFHQYSTRPHQCDVSLKDLQRLGNQGFELGRIVSLAQHIQHSLLAFLHYSRSIVPSQFYSPDLDRAVLEDAKVPVEHWHSRVNPGAEKDNPLVAAFDTCRYAEYLLSL